MIHLVQPTSDTDAANKKYVDDSKVGTRNYVKLDGTKKMIGDLDINYKNTK